MLLGDLGKAAILGIVEGITEFLPISSTGHLLLASEILGFPEGKAMRDSFDIFIQGGAVLAIAFFYRKELFGKGALELWKRLLLAFLPIGFAGFFFARAVKEFLFNPFVVGLSLAIGGLFLVWIDKKKGKGTGSSEKLPARDILKIGFFQIISLVPGVSRSAASIAGGLFSSLSRKEAAKFSFLLSVPTLGAATLYEAVTGVGSGLFSIENIPVLSVGFAFSFAVSLIAVKSLVSFLSMREGRGNFAIFGLYRIVAGLAIIGWFLFSLGKP